MRIAVVGAGIAGLSAAWRLSQRHDVVLFEQEPRVGGHSNTFVTAGGQPVDTGFIVYNENNYPNLAALFRELGVPTRASAMSFGVSIGGGRLEWAGDRFLHQLFAQRRNLLSAAHWAMLFEIVGFNRRVRRLLRGGALPAGSLGAFLDAHRYSPAFRTRYLLPMAAAIWSCSTRQALEFPFASFARFFDAHGLFDVLTGPPWRFVAGGSRVYVERLRARVRGEVRLGCPVSALRRERGGVVVTSPCGEERFDAAVCAAHPDQALALLADADAQEAAVLGAIPYADNEAFLHTDASLMPRRRAAWASWNYRGERDAACDGPVCVTYWMNRLQALAGGTDYFVTLNPRRPPAPETVLYHTVFRHPQFGAGALAAQRALAAIQGRRSVWFCGAWTGYGFHEDGLKSGLLAVQALDPACLPAWAALPQPGAPHTVPAPEAGALYPARVMHQRKVAPLYRFVYRVFYLLLDVDRMGELHRRLRLFSHNRFNLVSFHDRDHGDGRPGRLRAWVERLLAARGVDLGGGRIRLLTLPRILGYGFNPISLYYCEHRDGTLRAVIAEVNNTFGDRHSYVLGAGGEEVPWGAPLEKDKRLHVSPFFGMEGRYRFRLTAPEETVAARVREFREGAPVFDAALAGRRRALGDGALLAQVLRMPWMTLKVTFGIHWEALKLWLRGARFHARPAPPGAEAS